MRVLIAGCGYIGIPLGVELKRLGHEVFGLRRSAEAREFLVAAGIEPLVGDITRPDQLQALPGPFDWVVNLVSAGSGGPAVYRQVYWEGTRNLLDWLTSHPPKKFVYTSSTGVYAQTDGSQVKETSPTEPMTETGRVLLETETLLLRAVAERHFPAVILRVAGIYGPGRGYTFRQFLAGQARIEGRGQRLSNLIHQTDVVGVIVAVLRSGRPGEIYNAVDDEPVNQLHLFHWLAETLGRELPPHETQASPSRSEGRGTTHKRVLNRKLKMEIGYQFKYPTFRQGLTAEIQRMEEAGEL